MHERIAPAIFKEQKQNWNDDEIQIPPSAPRDHHQKQTTNKLFFSAPLSAFFFVLFGDIILQVGHLLYDVIASGERVKIWFCCCCLSSMLSLLFSFFLFLVHFAAVILRQPPLRRPVLCATHFFYLSTFLLLLCARCYHRKERPSSCLWNDYEITWRNNKFSIFSKKARYGGEREREKKGTQAVLLLFFWGGWKEMTARCCDATIAPTWFFFLHFPGAPMTWHRFSLFSFSLFLSHPISS